ncbi:putative elongation factor 1-gamma (EF-1-gamma) [Trypanosoma cruzi]|uniref:Putative elongation factor 1-gamma (EF-1-gamma) n=1 Tax=Trypanosoma cruzi TaxID=5693 RepID=A0A2V2XAN5_TRYCR|nr:putative elongation factor 1-gamma (EF-1-gamma) [Trypanosoma cruzi]PWV17870.1 putative elongation factor 1-gamma (EF-1-gamma) [Trypanosoma cruzi]PWV17871.1 putative elongation factor 1-gamma (EF-1-gamma) [Trypanosoma cruzi]PWV17872.1 putative elongation factor 1-gamma (EF-1-gamma) [Trypanosoma cruzi]PWV17873.1 putative elongation factor 1-gamma (EF-1-gamma) [Trypanosoma cruzi]
MSLTLWSGVNPENARTHKLLAAAALANVAVTLKACEYGRENETAEYCRNCSPCGRYPVLQTEEGCVFESNAILRHIARLDRSGGFLYGRTPLEGSQVDMWLDFSATELDAASAPFVHHAFRGEPLPANAMDRVHEVLRALEAWLETRTFLVGERMTVADVAVAFALQWHYRLNGAEGEALTKKYRNAYRLYNTVMQQPKTVEVLRSQGATFGPVKAERKGKDAAAPARAEKKPKAAAAAADGAEEEDEAPREKKKPNPLDELPPSPFVLDAFKREYSNTDTRTVAAPYFFQHYDAAGYTTFWCRYKYNEDNKMQFMTANLIRGWFQRMEHVRKYAFGVALIIGEERRHDIVALWVFRGRGMPAIVEDVEDTELFDWEEVADVAAQRERITDYLCWEGPTIPRPVLEGRVFK